MIRGRLEQRFREQGISRASRPMLLDTVEQQHRSRQARRFCCARRPWCYRDRLGDTAKAVELLRRGAGTWHPADPLIVIDLAATLEAGGDPIGALETISTALGTATEPAVRLTLLRTRATMRAVAGRSRGSLRSGRGLRPRSGRRGGRSRERARCPAPSCGRRRTTWRRSDASTLRCVDVMRARGNRDGALALLGAWLGRSPEDVESLRRLRELQIEAQQWEAVIGTCERLIALDTGPAQEDAAMALLTAYEMLGRPNDARAALELAREKQPDERQDPRRAAAAVRASRRAPRARSAAHRGGRGHGGSRAAHRLSALGRADAGHGRRRGGRGTGAAPRARAAARRRRRHRVAGRRIDRGRAVRRRRPAARRGHERAQGQAQHARPAGVPASQGPRSPGPRRYGPAARLPAKGPPGRRQERRHRCRARRSGRGAGAVGASPARRCVRSP